MHKISYPFANSQQLTQAVLQITEMLNMYQAELARVLQLKCGDVGQFCNRIRYIEPNTPAWEQAELFVKFYHCLYERMNGDEVAMCHWLRKYDKELAGEPLLLIVDEGRLNDVSDFICNKQ